MYLYALHKPLLSFVTLSICHLFLCRLRIFLWTSPYLFFILFLVTIACERVLYQPIDEGEMPEGRLG